VAVKFKAQSEAIREELRRRGVGRVYHWTLASQIPSILQHGLVCPRDLQARSIKYETHGYGTVGKDKQFAGFIVLSFLPHWGMMARATGPTAIIEMTSAVLAIDGTFYCPGNSARNDYVFDEVSTWTQLDDLQDLFEGPDGYRVKDIQAEVWIPGTVPVSAFRRVLFRTEGDLNATYAASSHLQGTLPRELVFQIEARRFPPAMEERAETIDLEDIDF
jgi:hypothetical protein